MPLSHQLTVEHSCTQNTNCPIHAFVKELKSMMRLMETFHHGLGNISNGVYSFFLYFYRAREAWIIGPRIVGQLNHILRVYFGPA